MILETIIKVDNNREDRPKLVLSRDKRIRKKKEKKNYHVTKNSFRLVITESLLSFLVIISESSSTIIVTDLPRID